MAQRMIRTPDGRMLPIAENALSPQFIMANQGMMIDPMADILSSADPMQAPVTASPDQIEQGLLQQRVDEEKERLRRRNITDRMVPLEQTEESLERRAVERVGRGLEREAARAERAESPSRARFNELLEANESRQALGLPPLPIPDELKKFSLVGSDSAVPRETSESDFVSPQEFQQMTPEQQMMAERMGLLGRFREGLKMQGAGLAMAGESEARGLDRAAQLMEQTARETQERNLAAEEARAQRLEQIQAQSDKYEQAVQKLSDFEFDPTGGFADKSNFNKILSIAAIGIGGIGDAFLGSPNRSLQIIDKAIQRDIDSQVNRFRALGTAAEGQRSVFGRMMDIFGSEEAARAASQAALEKSMAFKLEALSNRMGSEQARNKALEQSGALLQQSALHESQLQEMLMAKQPQLSERQQKVAEELTQAELDLEQIMADFNELNELAVVGQIVPGTAAKQFNKTILPRLERVLKAIDSSGGRGESIRKQVLSEMRFGSAAFGQTAEGVINSLKRDVANRRRAMIGVAGMQGQPADLLRAPQENFDFEETR